MLPVDAPSVSDPRVVRLGSCGCATSCRSSTTRMAASVVACLSAGVNARPGDAPSAVTSRSGTTRCRRSGSALRKSCARELRPVHTPLTDPG
jgi:hypothetical protein